MLKNRQINFEINGHTWRSERGCSLHNTFFYKARDKNTLFWRLEWLHLEGGLHERLLQFKRFKIRCSDNTKKGFSTYRDAEVDKILQDLNVKNDLSKRDL